MAMISHAMRLKRSAAAIFLPLPNMGSRTQLLNKQWYATAPVHKFEKYCPKIVESDWYDWWLNRGLFKPTTTSTATKGASTKAFSMLLPPPNVTDVALAIHSGDIRYKALQGKFVVHPLLRRNIPIICDDTLVDSEFGTGVVKITPAHDENDYACAQRHALQIVPVFQPDGTVINDSLFGEFVGKSRWDARRMIIDTLRESKAYVGKRDAEASVISRCSRSGDIIEPMLKPQWYVRCSIMAQRADEMVQTGNIDLIPERQRVIWHNWLAGIEDWCVSRQLWWGHRIPVYRIEWVDGNRPGVWVAAKSEQHAREEALMSLPSLTDTVDAGGIRSVVQDDDVLDTWFSSGLLPLTVFDPARGAGALSS
ncbi:hypothetical protein GGF37_003786, partial [Kickxella alabastrina]